MFVQSLKKINRILTRVLSFSNKPNGARNVCSVIVAHTIRFKNFYDNIDNLQRDIECSTRPRFIITAVPCKTPRGYRRPAGGKSPSPFFCGPVSRRTSFGTRSAGHPPRFSITHHARGSAVAPVDSATRARSLVHAATAAARPAVNAARARARTTTATVAAAAVVVPRTSRCQTAASPQRVHCSRSRRHRRTHVYAQKV